LEDVKFEGRTIDVVFFDAFAPSAQPELWRQEVFETLGEGVVDGGRLVTYCAQGEARRAMRAAGWRVEKAPGPPGKREMTVAFREAVNRFNVRAYALIVEDGRVLTVREDLPGGPATKFPGGGVEFGEGPEDAVLRELQEELGEAGAGEITGHAYTTGFYVRSIFRPSDQILSLYYYVRLNRPLDVPTKPDAPVKVAGGEAGLKWRWARVGELVDLAFPIDRHVAEHVLKA
jgi:ADP-ribose pyrophosphatase YjhB (NUDIX family)